MNFRDKRENTVSTFKQLYPLQAIDELMTPKKHIVNIQLAKFISSCFDPCNIFPQSLQVKPMKLDRYILVAVVVIVIDDNDDDDDDDDVVVVVVVVFTGQWSQNFIPCVVTLLIHSNYSVN